MCTSRVKITSFHSLYSQILNQLLISAIRAQLNLHSLSGFFPTVHKSAAIIAVDHRVGSRAIKYVEKIIREEYIAD